MSDSYPSYPVTIRRCILSRSHNGRCDVNDFDPPKEDSSRCIKRMYKIADKWLSSKEFDTWIGEPDA